MIQLREQHGNIYMRILDTMASFDYTLDKIRSIPGRSFKKNTGEYLIGRERIGEVLRIFDNQIVWCQPLEEIVKGMDIDDELVQQHLDWAKDDDFRNWHIKPYPYQRTGCHFLADRERAATFDSVGLGKTLQIIGAYQILKNQGKLRNNRCLIVTLSAVKRQFAKEVEKFTDMKAISVSGTASKRKKTIKGFMQRNDMEFLVVNYEMLRSKELLDLLIRCNFDVIALDEAHKIKSGVEDKLAGLNQSITAKCAYEIGDTIPYRFLATATPIQGKPQEIWSLFRFLDENILGSWEYFRERYTEYSYFGIKGAQNEAELNNLIIPYFIRRTKEMPEIQQQLPKVSHDYVFLEMTDTQVTIEEYILEQMAEMKQRVNKLPIGSEEREKADGIMQGYYAFLVENADSPLLFTLTDSGIAKKLLHEVQPKKLDKSPKLEYLLDFIEQALYDEPQSKFIIFTRFERMSNIIVDALNRLSEKRKQPFGTVVYSGKVSEPMRDYAKESFMNSPQVKVIVGTEAMSTGVNLQAANHIIHFDLPWKPSDIEQRNGRADRTGNVHPNVFITYLLMAESYEEALLALIQRKNEMAKNILDGGKVTGNSGDIYAQAMAKLERSKKNRNK